MKKLMVSTIILLPLLILAIMLVSGAIMGLVTHIYVESVEFVDDDTLILVMDDESAPPTQKCEVNILPLKAIDRSVEFRSEDESVVTIDENGVVTAKYYGTTNVIVKVPDRPIQATRRVVVTDKNVHSVKINDAPSFMSRGENRRLTATILPLEAAHPEVEWTSSAPEVLAITASGEAICMSSGVATITATSRENGAISDSVQILCREQLRGIAVPAGTRDNIVTTNSAQFPKLIPTPADAAFEATYTSSDESIAVVDDSGAITFLKLGHVVITATAVDGVGNTYSVDVEYNCTDGYYVGLLFDEPAYTFDYDLCKGKELSAITLRNDPNGTYREIVDVKFGKTGIIEFDKNTETFRLRADVADDVQLGEIPVTIVARKYSLTSHDLITEETDRCVINIERKTTAISFYLAGESVASTDIRTGSVAFAEVKSASESGSTIGVVAYPANHTDALSLSLTAGADVAEITGGTLMSGQTLNFNQDGAATVTVTAGDGSGSAFSKSLQIAYRAPQDTVKDLPVNGEIDKASATLSIADNGAKESLELQITEPAGTRATYISQDPEIADFVAGTKKLEPKKGGFATIIVAFESTTARSVVSECVIKIYVDRAVAASDIEIAFASDVAGKSDWTAKESGTYTVRINAAADAMVGKRVRINGAVASGEGAYSRNFTFERDDYALNAIVEYADEVESYAGYEDKGGQEVARGSRTIKTSHGNLKDGCEVEITYADNKKLAASGNDIAFEDVNDKLTFNVAIKNAFPADFEFDEENIDSKIAFTQSQLFSGAAKFVDKYHATVEITSKKAGKETSSLKVAGKSYTIAFNFKSMADELIIMYDGAQLDGEKIYNTLLHELGFMVRIGRKDGGDITDTMTTWTYKDARGEVVMDESGVNGTFKISGISGKAQALTVSSGKCSVTITLSKAELGELAFDKAHIEYNGESAVALDDMDIGEELHEVYLPKAVQGTIDVCMARPELENSLGGFDQHDLEDFFAAEPAQGKLTIRSVMATTEKIFVTLRLPEGDDKYLLDEQFTLHIGDKTLKLILNCMDLDSVEFADYKMDDPNAVYPGYQQARVFAKHSYLNGGIVDYFRIAVSASKQLAGGVKADIASLTWTLTDVNDGAETKRVIVRQRGTKVMYGEEEYTLVAVDGGPSTLKKAGTEEIIAQGGKYIAEPHVPFVDVLANEDSADIYFGNFVGLEEVDVQNDYFGNFGEKKGWTMTPKVEIDDDPSGRNYDPSVGAYGYLRIEAGDGAQSGVNAHFNFNVMNDESLVNIFDATGYYNNNRVVLQRDLYGWEELEGALYDKAKQNDQVLDNRNINANPPGAPEYAKSIIYGNGHKLNMSAYNVCMIEKNESNYILLNRMYNLKLMGDTANEILDQDIQKMYFYTEYAYYCDISYYWKLSPNYNVAGMPLYLKNTVLSSVPKTAVQIYYGQTLFAENITIVECSTGISVENQPRDSLLYFKGDIDILNYNNKTGLKRMSPVIGLMYQTVLNNIKDYIEWHGKEIASTITMSQNSEGNENAFYCNVALFSTDTIGDRVYAWKDGKYVLAENDSITFDNGTTMVNKQLHPNFQFYAWSYEIADHVNGGRLDGGAIDVEVTGTALTSPVNVHAYRNDFDRLLSENRYIRLLCEYKADGVKNYEHIAWHKDNCYRDKSLIEREGHMENLKKSLRDTQWPDGSGVDSEGNAYYLTAEAFNELMSTALPQDKKQALA